MHDLFAGVTLASMNVPQVLGYARIAGMPVVTGLYTVLLPIVAFAVFGSSRHLVVAADSATAVIFSGSLSSMAAPASEKYVALVGVVALLTAGILFLAWVFKLGFLADFLAHTVLVGFLTGVGLQVGIAMLSDMLGAVVTAAAVVAIGVEQGILLAIALSIFRHVRHSYNPHAMLLAPDVTGRWVPVPATPGKQTEPGLIVYRFGSDLFFANAKRFADQVRVLVDRAPTPVHWFIVDASAVTDIDFSAAQSVRDLIDELKRRGVRIVFARVSPYLRSDMDRHHITEAVGVQWIFTTLHEAITAVRRSTP